MPVYAMLLIIIFVAAMLLIDAITGHTLFIRHATPITPRRYTPLQAPFSLMRHAKSETQYSHDATPHTSTPTLDTLSPLIAMPLCHAATLSYLPCYMLKQRVTLMLLTLCCHAAAFCCHYAVAMLLLLRH